MALFRSPSTVRPRRLVLPGAILCLVSLVSTPLAAQQADPAPKSQPPGAHGSQPGLKGLDTLPKTADEKSRLLSNLYAHLATAESEAHAKSVSQKIERLWLHSGSDTVGLLLQRANKALARKEADLAVKFLDYAVQIAPDYPEAFNRRAYVHYTQGNYQQAVGDLRRVLALDPNHYKALDGLAQIWRQTGNKKGALNVLKQLLDVHPHWAGAKQAVEELTREVDGQGI